MIDPRSPEFRDQPPFQQLLEVMGILRGEQGCPWDRSQDHRSLTRYLQEETHELLEAIEEGDPGRICEELGDLLLQIVFHARLAEEKGHFDARDVCRGVVDKMVRRHPHIFGESRLSTPEEVVARWEEIKLAEKGGARRSLLDGIPRGLPALLQAERVLSRAAEVGFRWPPGSQGPGEKVREELEDVLEAAELAPEAPGNKRGGAREEEVGDLLLAAVALARQLEVDPEAALRRALREFTRRFRLMEERLKGRLSEASPEELGRIWQQAGEEKPDRARKGARFRQRGHREERG